MKHTAGTATFSVSTFRCQMSSLGRVKRPTGPFCPVSTARQKTSLSTSAKSTTADVTYFEQSPPTIRLYRSSTTCDEFCR